MAATTLGEIDTSSKMTQWVRRVKKLIWSLSFYLDLFWSSYVAPTHTVIWRTCQLNCPNHQTVGYDKINDVTNRGDRNGDFN